MGFARDYSLLLARVDEPQLNDVRALYQRDMQGRAACVREQASYIWISHENEEQGRQLPIMLDDSRARILDGVTDVTKVWAGTFEDHSI